MEPDRPEVQAMETEVRFSSAERIVNQAGLVKKTLRDGKLRRSTKAEDELN
jgi:hypothetical protein